ncbi:MAG: hypothetical protein A2428_17615 [Bdellovibrionales bacterium RIFOXYC1_FULL_54_43]|nr:MAG: hypothetical protein A2428_17615 [Bdellovibrionales bacterium RIFOXYC1_FULL_54_43]OFZ79504.1 MAG: hypothetical protein A2603_09855 [Bdellovibrionales bacterium RIFOXYD1_FULL_55_31]
MTKRTSKASVFEYRSYKRYLNDCAHSAPNQGRGFKAALAQSASCQSAYVSQVLNGDRHFNLEQAEGMNEFLGHSEDEAQFFLLLVMFERSATRALRERLQRKMQTYVERHQTLKDRLQAKETLSPEVQATYYGSWHCSAIHILLTIPQFRTKDVIAKALGLSSSFVADTLEFLVTAGLAKRVGNEFHPGEAYVFVGKDSPFILHHHGNWRHRAIESMAAKRADDIHYSTVMSISSEDAAQIRFLVLRAIEEIRAIRVPSKEEELHSMCLDLFRVA